MDFTILIGSISAGIGALIGALTAMAALKILPNVYKWGYNQVIFWFGDELVEYDKGELIYYGIKDGEWTEKSRS